MKKKKEKFIGLNINGLPQNCDNSTDNSLELLHSWVKPLI